MTDAADLTDLEAARRAIRDGADRLHARATFHKPNTRTPAEQAAIARAKLDARGGTP